MRMNDHERSVQQHYSRGGLLESILEALQAAGKDPDRLTGDDLLAVDEFHTRGRVATRELAALAEFTPGLRVLDVGSGLGGPARFLAAECGCDVTGLDLQPEFCTVANALSRRSGLGERTRFQQGSALAMPFADGAFDAAWTIQMQMNIADKPRLYGEIARVLRPGGRFVFQDICAGNGEPLHYPVPWASEPAHNHLVSPEALRALLGQVGLHEQVWRDISAQTIAWRKAQAAKAAARRATSEPPPALGLHLVLGERSADKQANSARNAEEGRVRSVQGVFQKPIQPIDIA